MDTSDRCPKCGSTDISLNESTGKLHCHFCRHVFEPVKDEDFSLEESVIYDGAKDIDTEADKQITLKCQHCGSEITVNLEESTGARCHWCRNTLSVNDAVPSGAVPDIILPFKITKDKAISNIESFAGNRTFFAHPRFLREFTTENVIGVYFPYFMFGIKGWTHLHGQGEEEIRKYTVGSGKNEETRYDADLYDVDRKFHLTVKNLTVESSADKIDLHNEGKTNNVINAIMPFDTENAVEYKTYYTKGYNIENRSLNVSNLDKTVDKQLLYISKFAIKDSIRKYDRGVCWEDYDFDKEVQTVKSAYFPVWLYSYMDHRHTKHYIAVNGRTEETTGSIPINFFKLTVVSSIIEFIALIIFRYLFWYMVFVDDDGSKWPLLLLLSGPIFFGLIYSRYRNRKEVHRYEEETDIEVNSLEKQDAYIKTLKGLKRSQIEDRNDSTREIDEKGFLF